MSLITISCASFCVGSCWVESEREPETRQARAALRAERNVAPAGLEVLAEAGSATAGESWGQSIWAYVEWDARRAHRHPESGTIVMKRPGYRESRVRYIASRA